MDVGEAVAGESVQARRVAADGVPGELGGSARRRALVGRHHSPLRRRLLRRDDPGHREIPPLYSTQSVQRWLRYRLRKRR